MLGRERLVERPGKEIQGSRARRRETRCLGRKKIEEKVNRLCSPLLGRKCREETLGPAP